MTSQSGARRGVKPLVRPMTIRDPDESGRTSTNLELFFDLVFVVTVSAVAGQWHHSLVAGHWRDGLISFTEMMFATWWAWMGFTWFANFFDPDDVPYRLLVLVQLLASLGLASGVPHVFADDDFRVVVGCYVVIRLVMSVQWLRAGHANPPLRRFCHRWAVGIWACQAGWIAFAFFRFSAVGTLPFFAIGVLAELAVPLWAHRLPAEETATAHPDHAEERYGLFAIIILGEMVLVTSDAFNTALDDHLHLASLLAGAIAAAIIAFSLWWLYFGFLGKYNLTSIRTAFIWGYGHFFVYASLAAIGAALAALLEEIAREDAKVPSWALALSLTLPVGVFLAAIALLRRVSEWASCNRWLRSAAVIVVVSTLVGARGALWALLGTCATTAAFLASEIVRKGKAAVVDDSVAQE
jgi:low temperature requirement protein LtrA